MRYVIIATSIVLVSAAAVSATVYVVNPQGTGDYPTIQAAVDAVMNGDIIELTDGTFTGDGNRDIDFLGKAIIVCSQTGSPADCIINCQGSEAQPHRGFHFHSDEGAGSIVEEITIRNGWAWTGGGVYCEGSASPAFIGCTFRVNEATSGGGMRGSTSSELIRCIFISNAARFGGGLYIRSNCSPALDECAFLGNSAEYSGGGMHCEQHCSPILTNCTFRENHLAAERGMRSDRRLAGRVRRHAGERDEVGPNQGRVSQVGTGPRQVAGRRMVIVTAGASARGPANGTAREETCRLTAFA